MFLFFGKVSTKKKTTAVAFAKGAAHGGRRCGVWQQADEGRESLQKRNQIRHKGLFVQVAVFGSLADWKGVEDRMGDVC